MKLTLTERLMLAHQFRTLARLTEDEHEAAHYEWCENVVTMGLEPLYDQLTTNFSTGDQVVTEAEGDYVGDILSLYEALRCAIEDHPSAFPADYAKKAKFPGFYGNTEYKLLGLANAICRPGHYDGLKTDGRIPDSHFPTDSLYRPMLQRWAAGGKKTYNLSPEDVRAILGESSG